MLQMLFYMWGMVFAITHDEINVIERKIGYRFKDKTLLTQVFSHNSLAQPTNFQGLEFLGDRIIGAVVADHVVYNQDNRTLGHLQSEFESKTNNTYLAQQFQRIGLGKFVKTNANINGNIIGDDAFEALIGAIYLDSNEASIIPQAIKQKVLNLLKKNNHCGVYYEHETTYTFKNNELLKEIFIHSSMRESKNFHKLKFLGEKILHAVLVDYIYRSSDKKNIGQMQNLLTSEIVPKNLAQKFQEMGFERFVQFNPSNDSVTVYSDTLKALIGGIYQDSRDQTPCNHQSVIKHLVLQNHHARQSYLCSYMLKPLVCLAVAAIVMPLLLQSFNAHSNTP